MLTEVREVGEYGGEGECEEGVGVGELVLDNIENFL